MPTTPSGDSTGQLPNTTPFSLPGFTLPLNFEPQDPRYGWLIMGNSPIQVRVRVQGDGRSLFANALQNPNNTHVGRAM